MNTLKIYPKNFREIYKKNLKNAGIEGSPESYHNLRFLTTIIVSAAFWVFFVLFEINTLYTIGVFIVLNIFFFMRINLMATSRIRKMEEVFPDVISLMASNLRSGVTIEKSFLISARPEFAPLDKEIIGTGREISTGKDMINSLKLMAKRIDSEKITKVIELIISGLRAGGNIADLLEETARNMKEKETLGKKIASTTMMYLIFIFFAVSVGAPVLFGLSSVLVEIIVSLTGRLPEVASTNMDLPFTFNQVSISLEFVIYFSVAFIIITDFISCFVIGLVNKGEGKTGLRYFLPMIAISLTLFFTIRKVLSSLLLEVLTAL